jgi:hypothetical protein
MGFAKAAELNGYPGPRTCSSSRRSSTSRRSNAPIRRRFSTRCRRRLRRWGASWSRPSARSIAVRVEVRDGGSLAAALARIGELQAKVRGAHLEAHLAQARILTPGQTARYVELRGYGSGHAH